MKVTAWAHQARQLVFPENDYMTQVKLHPRINSTTWLHMYKQVLFLNKVVQ